MIKSLSLATVLTAISSFAFAQTPYVQADYGVGMPSGRMGNQSVTRLHGGVDFNKHLAAELMWEGAWMRPYTPQGDFNHQTLALSGKLGAPANDVVSVFARITGGQMFTDGAAATRNGSPVYGAGVGVELNTKLYGFSLVGEYNYARSVDPVIQTSPTVTDFYNSHTLTVGLKKTF